MSVVAVIFVPIVLLDQAWTYHVFRQRVGGGAVGEDVAQQPPPARESAVSSSADALVKPAIGPGSSWQR